MTDINFWKIYDICMKHRIGLNQMGYVYPRIMKYITENNQNDILEYIGYLADKGLSKDNIIEEIKSNKFK